MELYVDHKIGSNKNEVQFVTNKGENVIFKKIDTDNFFKSYVKEKKRRSVRLIFPRFFRAREKWLETFLGNF